MLEQGVCGGLPATELLEHLCRCDRASEREHGVAEPLPGALHSRLVVEACLLECCKRVSRQDLGPLVAVGTWWGGAVWWNCWWCGGIVGGVGGVVELVAVLRCGGIVCTW